MAHLLSILRDLCYQRFNEASRGLHIPQLGFPLWRTAHLPVVDLMLLTKVACFQPAFMQPNY